MKKLYEQKYLENLIALRMDLDVEFAKWSVDNGDKGLDMLRQHEIDFEEIVKVLRKK